MSSPGTINWSFTSLLTSAHAVSCVGVVEKSGVLYAAINDSFWTQNYFTSADNGVTWNMLSSLPDAGRHFAIVNHGGRLVIFYSNSNALVYSDNGTSWTKVTAPANYSNGFGTVLSNGTAIIANRNLTGGGIYRSLDAVAWTYNGTAFGSNDFISGGTVSGTTFYLVGHDATASIAKLWVSTDSGVTWAAKPLPTYFIPRAVVVGAAGRIVVAGQASPDAAGTFVYVSDDGGTTWTGGFDTTFYYAGPHLGYGNGVYVLYNDNSNFEVGIATDAQAWTVTDVHTTFATSAPFGMAFLTSSGNGFFFPGVSSPGVFKGTFVPPPPPPPPNDGRGIVFEPLTSSPETLGDTVLQLPHLQFRASELDRALRCDLPLLQFAATGEMTAQDVGDLVMTLPAFDWYADNVDVGVLTTYRGFIRAVLPPLALSGNDIAEPIPQSADAVFVLPPIGFAATGFQKLTGTLIMTLPAFKMFAFDSAGQHLIMELPPPSFAASNRTTIVRNAVSMQAQPVMSLLASNTWVMTDTLSLNDIVLDELFFVLKDRLALNDNVSMLGVFVGTVTSSLVARDFVRFVLDMAVDETLTLTEQLVITPTAILALASQLMLQDQSLGLMNAIAVITSGLVLLDRLRQDATATIDSALDLADIVEANLTLITTLASEALLTDEALGSMTLMGMVSSDLQLADSADALLTLLMTLDDTASFVVRFSTPEGDQFAGYMVNIRNAAVSSVTNYNFNSFATLKRGGRNVTLAFKPGGVYQLGGKTDDGAAIPARVRLGLSDFGTSALKRVANAILGYTSDGRLRLKVITTDGGRKKENWYALKPRAADSPVEGRLDIAKGLVARYWGFELTNVDGADFKLDELKVWPMLLQRHKSGR